MEPTKAEHVSPQVSLETLSRYLRCSPRWVNKLALERDFPHQARGKYNLQACIVWYVEYLRRALKDARSGTDATRLAEEQAAIIRTELLKDKLAHDRGELVKVDSVRRQWEKLLSVFKNRLLILPTKAAGLIPSSDRVKTQEILTLEIKEILNELSTSRDIAHPRHRRRRPGKHAKPHRAGKGVSRARHRSKPQPVGGHAPDPKR